MLCSPMMGQETEQQMGRQMGQQMGQQTERQREQQFTYYWYAARQAQEAKEYDRALMLLLLCEQAQPQGCHDPGDDRSAILGHRT